jgi:succinate dehydrogenase / fumarate reductase cytochrome b subunit
MKEYAYFPGCAAEATTREADKASQELLCRLGVSFHPLQEFSCCGAGCLSEEHPKLNLALNARNLALAEAAGWDILTLCNTCFLYLRKSQRELQDPTLRQEINGELKKLGLEYAGKVEVIHLLHLLGEIGAETIREKVSRPLHDLRVAAFYGCHLLRPPHILGTDSRREPTLLEELIQATGAIPLDYRERLDCCGFHLLLVDEKTSLRMAAHCLEGAQEVKADLLVTPCTLCHISLDMYQDKAARLVGKSFDLPILHLAQLVGLALGIDPGKLHLQNHFVDTKALLQMGGAESGTGLTRSGNPNSR